MTLKSLHGDFPGGAVVKNLCFHCRGRGFDPCLGTKILHAVQCGQKQNKTKTNQRGTSLVAQWLRTHLPRASLVAQWLRIRLPMQGTWVRAPVREDPTWRGAARPVSHNYWACASGACAPQRERPRQWEARAPRWKVAPARRNWRKPSHRNEDPPQP